MAEIESILDSVKHALGIDPSDEAFDPELIMHINSVFSTLHQLGLGPDVGYAIDGTEAIWTGFLGTELLTLNMVKSYMFLRVKLLFDPPANSFATTAIKEQITEFEWRIRTEREATWTPPLLP